MTSVPLVLMTLRCCIQGLRSRRSFRPPQRTRVESHRSVGFQMQQVGSRLGSVPNVEDVGPPVRPTECGLGPCSRRRTTPRVFHPSSVAQHVPSHAPNARNSSSGGTLVLLTNVERWI